MKASRLCVYVCYFRSSPLVEIVTMNRKTALVNPGAEWRDVLQQSNSRGRGMFRRGVDGAVKFEQQKPYTRTAIADANCSLEMKSRIETLKMYIWVLVS